MKILKISQISVVFIAVLGMVSCAEEKVSEEQRKLDILDILEEYEACSQNAHKNNDCKCFTAQAICEYYGISDFKDEKGEYIEYHDIHDYILENPEWKSLGMADEKGVLVSAHDQAVQGYPVLAVDTEDKHKFVVMILPGEMGNSRKWGGEVPQSAAFFPASGPPPFIDQTINYAWSSPQGIQFWVKK